MHTAQPSLSANSPAALQNPQRPAPRPAIASPAGEILAQHWPTLSNALARYSQRTAEQFSQLAYQHVRAGLIRRTDRLRLAAAAENLHIRDFDAQLLIACAIRQWAFDHHASPESPEKLPRLAVNDRPQIWLRFVAILAAAALFDTLLLWKWLG